MHKTFFSNLILILLLNVLIKPLFIFGVDIQIQNRVGPEDYGMYFTLLNFSFLLNMFLDIGITNFNTKHTAQHPETVPKYIGSYLGLKGILGLFYAGLTIGGALLIGYSNLEIHFLCFFVLNQLLAGMIFYLRSNFSGLHLFKVDALLSVLDRSILIIICMGLLYGSWSSEPFQIEWFIYAQTIAYGISLLIAILLTRIKIGKIKIRVKQLFSIAVLKKSTPLAILILFMMLYTRMDAVMLERLLPDGKKEAGIYAQGFRLLDVVNMFAFLIAGLLLPIFARLIGEKKSVLPVLQTASKFLIGISLLVGIVFAIHAKELLSFIYVNNVSYSSTIFFWIILSFIPLSFSHIFGTLLTANHNLKVLNIMALCGIGINLTLNFILIPLFAAKGAAIATITTQSITALTQFIFVFYIFRFSIHWSNVLRIISFAVLLISGTLLSHQYLGQWSIFYTFIGGGILLFALRLIDFKNLVDLLPSQKKD